MGKTRDLFKEIRDTKGTFHAKIITIKDRRSKDLTEVEEGNKRWQEYTEALFIFLCKDFHLPSPCRPNPAHCLFLYSRELRMVLGVF